MHMEEIKMKNQNHGNFLSGHPLVLFLVLFCPFFLFAQRQNKTLEQFQYPCFLKDKHIKRGLELSGHFRDGREFMIQPVRSYLKLRMRSQTNACLTRISGKDPIQKVYSFFNVSADEVLVRIDTLHCSDYLFACALFQKEYCGKDGKMVRYHYKALCDTLIDGIYGISLSFTSDEYDNTDELKKSTIKDLKPMKHLHLISPLSADHFTAKMEFPEKKIHSIFLEKAKKDKKKLAEKLLEYKAGINSAPLEGIGGEKYFLEIENLVVQNKSDEALDKYYSYKLIEYQLLEQELSRKFEMTNFSPRNYVQSYARFDRNQMNQNELLQFLHNPDTPGPVHNYAAMMEMGRLFMVDNKHLSGYFDYAMDAIRSNDGLKERLSKIILANVDSLINPLECADFRYESCYRSTDTSSAYFYFPMKDTVVGSMHIVHFEKKNEVENNWSKRWIKLPFSKKQNELLSSEGFGNNIYFRTTDSTYFIILHSASAVEKRDLNNYDLCRWANETSVDTTFNYVCNEVDLTWNDVLTFDEWQSNLEQVGRTKHVYDNDRKSWIEPETEKLAIRSDPSCVLYKRCFHLADLNLDGAPEFYSYSISNGEVMDCVCYTLVNNEFTKFADDAALEMIRQDEVYKKLILYSQMAWE